MAPTVLAMILAVLGTGVHQIEGIMIKKYNSKHKDGGFIFVAMLSFFSMLFFLITDKGGLIFPIEMIPYGIIAGFFYCMASFLTYVALGIGSFVLTNLFLSYSLLFSVGYGLFFLKEEVTVFTYVGLLLLFIAIFLVRSGNAKEREKGKGMISVKWVLSVVLSVLGSGMFGVMQKLQQVKFERSCDNEFMIVTLGFSTLTLLIVGLIMNGKEFFYILRHGSLYAGAAGISNGATNLLTLIANALVSLSIAAPIRSGVKIVMSFLISVLIFRERLTRKQTVGVILGTAALILFNLNV